MNKLTALMLLVALGAIAVIIASSATVLTKDYEPQLKVEVDGIPGYVYYDKDYDITIRYYNRGGDTDGPTRLTAELPSQFTLKSDTEHGRRSSGVIVWELGTLKAGESGEIQAQVRGTVPTDLTGAVYDLPGYVGHTAFVDGFSMKLTLGSGAASSTTFATADTGAPAACNFPGDSFCLFLRKQTDIPGDPTEFRIEVRLDGNLVRTELLANGEYFTYLMPSSGTIVVTEVLATGWAFSNWGCEAGYYGLDITGDPLQPSITIEINPDPQNPLIVAADCTFRNSPACDDLGDDNCFYVFKSADPADGTDFAFTATAGDQPPLAFQLADGDFRGFPIPSDPNQSLVVTEESLNGWNFQGFECTASLGLLIDADVRTLTVSRNPQVTTPLSGECTFTNAEDADPEPTPQPSPSPVPTSVPQVRSQPNIGAGLSGLFNGQPTPLPTAPSAVAPSATIRPPNTGDGGLR